MKENTIINCALCSKHVQCVPNKFKGTPQLDLFSEHVCRRRVEWFTTFCVQFSFSKNHSDLKMEKNQKFANIFILLHRTIAKRKFEIKNYLKFCLNFLPPKWATGKTSCFEFPFMVNKKKETWRRLKNCLQTLFCWLFLM